MSAKRKLRPNRTGRDDGEQYLPISYRMARCDAWRSLGGAAMKVWVELRTRFNGKNNGTLSLSWDEAAKLLAMGKNTVGRAFEELEAKGFIAMTRKGQWYGRLASLWAVTDRSHQGNPPTHAYLRWRNPNPPKKQSLGFITDHIEAMTGPPQNRELNHGSTSEPVRGNSPRAIGAETDHLYNHGVRDSAHEG